MNHPEYPLQLDQRIAIVTAPNDPDTIRKIQEQFAKRRDFEFPGWREEYHEQVMAWLSYQQKGYKLGKRARS